MSTLSVTTINTANNTTDLTVQNGNTSAGRIIIPSSEGVVLASNSSSNVVFVSNNSVGIGTNSPSSYSSKLAVVGGQTALVGNASYNPLYLQQIGGSSGYTINCENFNTSGATGYGGIGFAARGSNPYSGYYGALRFNWSVGGIWQFVDAAENLTNISVSGIKFPATQSASSDANTLDDYEEGTWSPRLNFGGVDHDGSYGYQTGYYCKIGQLLHLSGIVGLSTAGTTSGAAKISNLPFSVVQTIGSSISQFYGAMSSMGYGVAGDMGATQVTLYTPTTIGLSTLTKSNFTVGAGNYIQFNFTVRAN